jgi:dolichol-phosphate mannosyltransferase
MASTIDSLEVGSAAAAAEAAVLPRLSVIVPCCNEADSLETLAAKLRPLRSVLEGQYEIELLLVDDGSTDETWRLLQKYFSGDATARLIKHEVNRGIAAAIGAGFAHASGEMVASLDADFTYDPLQLVALLKRMTPDVDLVVASPYHPQGKVEGVPGWRLALSRLASRMYRAVMQNKLYTYTSCVRVYRRSAVVDLPVRRGGFVGIVELVWQLDRRGGRIVECPAVLTVRTTGHSKMRVARVAWAHLGLLAEAAWDRLIGRREQSAAKTIDSITNQTSRFATRTV